MIKGYNIDASTLGGGSMANRLMNSGMDVNVLKPWIGADGHAYQAVMNNGKPMAMRVNAATLRKEEWVQLDTAVLAASLTRLVAVADLYSRDLVYRIGNGLAQTVLQYQDTGEMTAAEITMDAVTGTQRDRPEYGLHSLPLPIIHKDFTFNSRFLAESRNMGRGLDVLAASQAARVVAEKVEDMLINGTSNYTYAGATLYGYVDFPQNNDVTLTHHWDASGCTPEMILDDVRSMKQANIDVRKYGPYVLYVPTGYETVLDDDYNTISGKTIRERILGIQNITDVKVLDTLPAHHVLLIQMDSETVRMVEGLPINTVEWQEGGGFVTNYKVLTIMVPQIRADQNGNCGVCLLS